MNHFEALRVLKELPDHRSEISKLFRKSLARHGLTSNVLKNQQVRHVMKHGYRKREQYIAVVGYMYCGELWRVLEARQDDSYPVFAYTPAYLLKMKDARLMLDEELDISAVEEHFDLMIGTVVAPMVRAVQSPIEAVRFADQHPSILSCAQVEEERRLSIWKSHYGLK